MCATKFSQTIFNLVVTKGHWTKSSTYIISTYIQKSEIELDNLHSTLYIIWLGIQFLSELFAPIFRVICLVQIYVNYFTMFLLCFYLSLIKIFNQYPIVLIYIFYFWNSIFLNLTFLLSGNVLLWANPPDCFYRYKLCSILSFVKEHVLFP